MTNPDMQEPTYLHSKFGGDICWIQKSNTDTLTVRAIDIIAFVVFV